MAYIQPNSTIEFFSDLNLSDKYTDSLYFASVSAKDTYFTNLTKVARVLTCTYTRENRGFVRVEVPMATLIGASYMRFKNTSFENKWFYAFVKNVNYINNQTTEVRFELDPLMTWMGTFSLNECYIERQHTVRDGIGNNIAEEGLPTGEYIVEARRILKTWDPTSDMVAVLACAQEFDPSTQYNPTYGGIPSAIAGRTAPAQTYSIMQIVDLLTTDNQLDSLQSITLQPSEYVDATYPTSGTVAHISSASFAKPYTSLNGYVPRNNKLFCFPYKFCTLASDEGDSQDLMYEYMGGQLPDQTSSGMYGFAIYGCSYPTGCEVTVEPSNYKGVAGTECRLSISHFPQVAWQCDTYEAYLAQKNAYLPQDIVKGIASLGGNVIGGAVTAGLSANRTFMNQSFSDSSDYLTKLHSATGAPKYGGALGAVNGLMNIGGTVANNLIENAVRPASPIVPRGSNNIDLMFSRGLKGFLIYEKCITKNYAMMIDSYFDMFGYAIREHGVPNMNARPNWTYVKTIGCNVGGAIPADDATAIEAIFDNGIRFWKNHNNIGDYSLSNAPST